MSENISDDFFGVAKNGMVSIFGQSVKISSFKDTLGLLRTIFDSMGIFIEPDVTFKQWNVRDHHTKHLICSKSNAVDAVEAALKILIRKKSDNNVYFNEFVKKSPLFQSGGYAALKTLLAKKSDTKPLEAARHEA